MRDLSKSPITIVHRNIEGLITEASQFFVGKQPGEVEVKTLAETQALIGGVAGGTVVALQPGVITLQTGGFGVSGKGIVGAGQQIKGPAIVNSGFAGTVGSSGATVTFSSAADAILAGYNATSPALGTTLIASAQTRIILSWTNATTCTVDSAPDPAWSGTAITSAQGAQLFSATSAGVLSWAILASGVLYQVGNAQIYPSADAAALLISIGGLSRLEARANTDWTYLDAPTNRLALTDYSDGGLFINGGNVGLGTTDGFGTSAAKVLSIGAGTAPETAPADVAQVWAGDYAAGYCGLWKRTETTNLAEIIPGVYIKTDTGDAANPYEGFFVINTFDNTVKIYADAGWRTLASGW